MSEKNIEMKSGEIDRLNSKMKKKPYIPGVSGLLHLNIIEKLRGSSDAKNHQISIRDSFTETPYVLSLNESLSGYSNKIYSLAVQALSDMYKEISTLNTEMENIRNRTEEIIDETGEEAIRQQEAKQARIQADTNRTDEIRIHTAWLKENFEIADESVKHHIDHANRITRVHISEYWRGILKRNGGSIDLPAYPVIETKKCEGLSAYLSHREQICSMITNILSVEKEVG